MQRNKILCYGIGNISRADDGLGPALMQWLEAQATSIAGLEFTFESAFQLQPENIFEFNHHDAILFLDASVAFKEGARFGKIEPQAEKNAFVSHALPPPQLLAMFADILQKKPPDAYLLTMGCEFTELSDALSSQGDINLEAGKQLLKQVLDTPLNQWSKIQSAILI